MTALQTPILQTPILQTTALIAQYGQFRALFGVDITLKAGKTVAIMSARADFGQSDSD